MASAERPRATVRERDGFGIEAAGHPEMARALWHLVLPGAVALALGLGLLGAIWLFARPLALLVIGVTLAQALAPLAGWLYRWMPRGAAVIVVYLTLLGVALAVGWFTLAPLVGEARSLVDQMPALADRAQSWVTREDERLAAIPLAETLRAELQGMMNQLLAVPLTLASAVFDAILVLFLSLYMLLAAPRLERFALSLLPEHRRQHARDVIEDMGRTMGGYVRGVFINILIIGVLVYLGLRLIGVEYALVLGLLAGLLEVIPIVGSVISVVLIVTIAFLLHSPHTALITLVFLVIVQQIEGNVLTPNVMRSQTDIPALLILVALIAGGGVAGLLGALVAIPLAGALYVLTRQVIAPLVRDWTGALRRHPDA
jgi:predicted PurR-regulated permease PerM